MELAQSRIFLFCSVHCIGQGIAKARRGLKERKVGIARLIADEIAAGLLIFFDDVLKIAEMFRGARFNENTRTALCR